MKQIHIVEVGPRDGLQNEPTLLTVDKRIQLIDKLSPCGFREIEVGSFVSPKWVPQMENTAAVYAGIQKVPGVIYSALVPNGQGMDDAEAAHIKSISVFTAASETFCLKNTNCSIEESFQRFAPILDRAKAKGMRIRGYVSTVITCPFEGVVPPAAVASVAQRLWDMGCNEISLGDTIGSGTPETITAMLNNVIKGIPVSALAIHCHDTFGSAINNILAALDLGVTVVDSAIRGLGGCPYAGGEARGNVATELVVESLHKAGFETSIDQQALSEAGLFVDSIRNN
jgi:hydroxymethylglutaryl-CoA lyase